MVWVRSNDLVGLARCDRWFGYIRRVDVPATVCSLILGRFAMACPTCEYRDIEGFPGYRVGSDGSVWSRHPWRKYRSGEWRQLTPVMAGKQPHLKVSLTRNGKVHQRWVARLVLEAFVGACPPGMECCHDPDPSPGNNALKNLRWGTRQDNVKDCIRHGRHFTPFKRPPSVSSELQESIRDRASKGESIRAIGKSLGVSKSTVGMVSSGKGCYAGSLKGGA